MPTPCTREQSTRSFSSSGDQRLQNPSRMLYSKPSFPASSLQVFISLAVTRGREAGPVEVVVVVAACVVVRRALVVAARVAARRMLGSRVARGAPVRPRRRASTLRKRRPRSPPLPRGFDRDGARAGASASAAPPAGDGRPVGRVAAPPRASGGSAPGSTCVDTSSSRYRHTARPGMHPRRAACPAGTASVRRRVEVRHQVRVDELFKSAASMTTRHGVVIVPVHRRRLATTGRCLPSCSAARTGARRAGGARSRPSTRGCRRPRGAMPL